MLADKVADAANVAVGALVFGQFLSAQGFSLPVAVLGLVAWTAFIAWAVALEREGGEE